MRHEKMIMVTAEIPEEFLEDWRIFVVIRGGKVLVPRSKREKEEQLSDQQIRERNTATKIE